RVAVNPSLTLRALRLPGASLVSAARPHLLFVTGKLAEPSLRRLLADLTPRAGFDASIAVLPITVVSLATTAWIARHLTPRPDVIDLGCGPGVTWAGVGDAVRALRQEGLRVSIDSFNPVEVEQASAAGAELVLSVNHSNIAEARDWGCEVVVLPDDPATLAGL